MAPRIAWSNLLPGLIALAVVLMIATGVLLFAGVGDVHGRTMHVYVLADQARGVMKGTEVWLMGQKVGIVEAVGFRPPTSDTSGRVVITVVARARDAQHIHRDSRVDIRPGMNIIGPPVVYVTSGSPSSAPIREGDTLRGGAQADFEGASVKLSGAAEDLGPIMTDVRAIAGRVRDPNGTVGALLTERGGGQLARLRAHLARFHPRVFDGDGSSGVSQLSASVRAAFARVDSIRTLLSANGSSYGRLRRDSTLGGAVASVRDELARLETELAHREGTIARAQSDSALTHSVSQARREMALLFDDIRRRPLHYVHF